MDLVKNGLDSFCQPPYRLDQSPLSWLVFNESLLQIPLKSVIVVLFSLGGVNHRRQEETFLANVAILLFQLPLRKRLRVLAALPEDPRSQQPCSLTTAPGDLMPSSGHFPQDLYSCTQRQKHKAQFRVE